MSALPASRSPVYRVTRLLIWFVYAFAVAAVLFLATAFFLRLFNANESAPFVQWVDRATRILMEPFRGIFPSVEGERGSVFDASLLFAIFMYGLLATGVHALLDWIDRKAAAQAAEVVTPVRPEQRSDVVAAVGRPPYVEVPETDARDVHDPASSWRGGGGPPA